MTRSTFSLRFDVKQAAPPNRNNAPPLRPRYRAPYPDSPHLLTAAVNIQSIYRTLNRHILATIANLPLQHPLARLNLRRNDIVRNRHGILLRHPILRPTQQHIATLTP